MILIGQYDSSFVRRVGIALTLYGIPFQHWPWSTFGDAEKLRAYNPLMRVPVLVLDDGDVMVESHSIIDFIDGLVSEDRLFPVQQPERRQAMTVAAKATGLADMAVRLFYEKALHERASELLVNRGTLQIINTLASLETERAARPSPFWFGERMGHADIAVTTALRHMREAHPTLADLSRYPALDRHASTMEELTVFRTIFQPFIPPAAAS
jgi:glutathione S-transferase